MVTVPRRMYLRTVFSSSGSSIGYGSDPRTDTFRYRLLTVRTSTDSVRLSPWWRASPKPVMLSSTGASLRRDHLVTKVGLSGRSASNLATLTWIMMSRTQMPAMVRVIRVNVSPALDPNGLEPPAPPNAPTRPPPFPRWIRMVRMRSRPSRMMSPLSRWDQKITAIGTVGLRTAVGRTRASVRVSRDGSIRGGRRTGSFWHPSRERTGERPILASPAGGQSLRLLREHRHVPGRGVDVEHAGEVVLEPAERHPAALGAK